MTDFLEHLFGGLTNDHGGYLWVGQTKRSHWYSWPTELSQASLQAASLADAGQDVYFSVGLGPSKLSAGQRTGMASVTAIAGLWVDIDYKWEGHKKQNLPPTINEAVQLAADMPQPPTAIISTGHGIQAWWLFKEPWEFETPAERAEAAWMVEQWQRAVRARASEQGWDVDATHDLARVMRIPGTSNFKDLQHVQPVEVLEEYYETRRYARTDLELYMLNSDPTLKEPVVPVELGVGWKPSLIEHTDRFQAMMEEEPLFRQSWEHKRDFQDQSLSSYDLSLASLAAGADWSDDEIANLIAEHRRKSGDPAKGMRKDYLERTIAVARRKGETEQAIVAIMAGEPTALTSGDNAEKARGIWAKLGIKDVLAWYKVLGDQTEFVLVTLGRETRLSEEVFTTYTNIQKRLIANLGTPIKGIKGQAGWYDASSALVLVAEVRGEAADPEAQVRGWLDDYISGRELGDVLEEHRRDHLSQGGLLRITDPRAGDIIALKGADFLRFIQANEAEDSLSISELRRLWLRAGGDIGHSVAVAGTGPSKHSTVKVWTIPFHKAEQSHAT